MKALLANAQQPVSVTETFCGVCGVSSERGATKPDMRGNCLRQQPCGLLLASASAWSRRAEDGGASGELSADEEERRRGGESLPFTPC